MNFRFSCPACEQPGRLQTPLPAAWVCPKCDQALYLKPVNAEPALTACVLCDNDELYRRKDFPQALGVAILALCCVASTATYFYYQQWWTWSILIGSAVFDCLLYLLVKDVVVCYRCDAQYRALSAGPKHQHFELTTFERYRQEQMRRKQLQ